MEIWKTDYYKGKECLGAKDFHGALTHLYSSVKQCPVENEIELADVFFYLGVVFKNLGWMEPAVRSWDVSMCADKGGRGAGILSILFPEERLSNDRSHFYLIQVSIYLGLKSSEQFDSDSEKDMIFDLISTYWDEIVDSGILKGKCQAEKILIFRDININFPYIDNKIEQSILEFDNTSKIVPFQTNIKSD